MDYGISVKDGHWRYRAIFLWVALVFPAVFGRAGVDEVRGGGAVLPVKLEIKFDYGRELVYSFVSSLDQEIRTPGLSDVASAINLTGTVSQIVVDGGEEYALIGQMGQAKLGLREGAERVLQSRDQAWLCVYRTDRRGVSVLRHSEDADLDEKLRRMAVSQIGDGVQVCARFPSRAMKQGDKWKGEVAIPMPWGRQKADAISRIVDVYKKDGGTLCVIRSDVSFKGLACPGYLPHFLTPHVEVEGASEGCLDVEKGVWTRIAWNLTSRLEGRGYRGFEGEMRMSSEAMLQSVRMPGVDEMNQRRRKFRDLDSVLATLYGNDIERALRMVEKNKNEETDEQWKKGLELTLSLLRPVRDAELGVVSEVSDEDEGTTPEGALMEKADRAAFAERWQDAVAAYEALVKEHPASDLVPEALASAAVIYERKLGQKAVAAELNRRLIVVLEGSGGESGVALTTFKLAGAYATAGDSEKAVKAYRDFLAAAGENVQAGTRILARYRLAVLLEELGRPREAVEAYRELSVAEEGDDEYSSRVRRKAAERLKELSGSVSVDGPVESVERGL